MNVRVMNVYGDQIKLSPPIKSAIDALSLEADKTDVNWDEITHKILRVLEGDGFDGTKLQSEVVYFDTKKGKKITEIRIDYSDR